MERSAGAVIFYKNKREGTIVYLLLHYPPLDKHKPELEGHWDFPKGHVEAGETEAETVSREVAEETGITQLAFAPGFREKIRYFFQKDGKRVCKEVVFFLAQSNSKKVQLSFEHVGFAWLPFDEARANVTFQKAKDILEKAHAFLQKDQTLFYRD